MRNMPWGTLVEMQGSVFYFITYGKILILLKSDNPVATKLRIVLQQVHNQTWLTWEQYCWLQWRGLCCGFKTFTSADCAWQITTKAQLDLPVHMCLLLEHLLFVNDNSVRSFPRELQTQVLHNPSGGVAAFHKSGWITQKTAFKCYNYCIVTWKQFLVASAFEVALSRVP